MRRKRDYKQEYRNYHGKPEQLKKRSSRNAARRLMERAGLVRKGDKKDVHHKNRNPLQNNRSNLSITSRSKNRSNNRPLKKK